MRDGTKRDTKDQWSDGSSPGRPIVIGSVIGGIISLAVVGGGMLIAGQSMGASLGLGLFVAAWGGIGFGSMIGGVAWGIALERDAATKPSADPKMAGAVGEAPKRPAGPPRPAHRAARRPSGSVADVSTTTG